MSIMVLENINESFCERILQTHQKYKNIQVLEIKKELATSKGDNYLSAIYRILVKYYKYENRNATNPKNIEEMRLLLKIKHPDSASKSGSESVDDAFLREIHMFTKVLPRIEKYVGCSLSPFLFYVDENSNYIIMEDLGRKGYIIEDRFKGLSFEHCLRSIEKMAKFHAGSVAIAEREPELIKAFHGVSGIGTFPENFYKFLRISLEKLSNTIEERWKDEEYQEIACKLRKIVNELKTRVIAAFEYSEDEFCVLNHGDFWTNNIMFKHNEQGKPCDAIMIDFQIISYTSPAIDLQHFLAMCPEFDIKCDKDDYILETYLTVLKSTMKEIDCKTHPPSMEQVKKAMLKRGAYSILTGLIYYPRVIVDKKDVEDFNDILDTGETHMDIFKNPLAAKVIRKFSKAVKDKGYLD